MMPETQGVYDVRSNRGGIAEGGQNWGDIKTASQINPKKQPTAERRAATQC